LISLGEPAARAHREASSIAQSRSGSTASIPRFIRLDFAHATQSVLYVMAGIMAVAAIAGMIGLRAGVQEEAAAAGETGETTEPDRPEVAGSDLVGSEI
jgi:hypothetical protein